MFISKLFKGPYQGNLISSERNRVLDYLTIRSYNIIMSIETSLSRLLKLKVLEFAKTLRKFRHCNASLEDVEDRLHQIKSITTTISEIELKSTVPISQYDRCIDMLRKYG